jgi:hypothetical protein
MNLQNLQDKLIDIIYRYEFFKRQSKSKHTSIPFKQWQKDTAGRWIGKNGKPRWINGGTAKLIVPVVYEYMERNHPELLKQIHEHSQGEMVEENFDNNSAIYTFIVDFDKESRKFMKSVKNELNKIRIPFEYDGEKYLIELEIEDRPPAILC